MSGAGGLGLRAQSARRKYYGQAPERFDAPETVSFRCEWHGLSGRLPLDPQVFWRSGQLARDDDRIASGTWPVSSLGGNWAEIVSQLAGPVARLFGISHITPQWVLGQAPLWKR